MAKWGGPSGNLTWPLNSSKKTESKNKTKKQNQQNKQKTNPKGKKTNKEGLGPSEVVLWATSPDP